MIDTRELGFRIRNIEQQLRALRSYDPERRRTRLPGPFSVQLQTIDCCNASCPMCPYSFGEKPRPVNRMDDALYERILGELRATGTLRLLALMLQNEPLLDRALAERIRWARAILGDGVHIGIVTNGAALTTERLDGLLEAGIGSIEVSIDAFREDSFEKIRPGLSFSKVVENTRNLLARGTGIRIAVRFLRQRANAGEEAAFKRYWESHGAMVRFLPLVNRAGTLDDYQALKPSRGSVLRSSKRALWELMIRIAGLSRSPIPCLLPFTWLNVLWDGRVILCCHDWAPADVIGDLSAQSLQEVWNGDVMNNYRQMLWSNSFDNSTVCKDCSIAKRD
jgi:MoaA/NifB/PqqE/SkfB family radical SAM enzyme